MATTESPHTGPDNLAHSYCIAFYDVLESKSKDGVFKGSVTEVYQTLGISNNYYSKIIKSLVEIGSLEYVQRGHHKRPTIYKLHKRPTIEELEHLDYLTPRTRRARVTERELLQRLETLERSVRGVDIVAAFTNLEARIVALEKRK